MDNSRFFVPIDQLTPSQLYISAEKLAGVRAWFDSDSLTESLARMDPIPLKRMAGRLLMLDGHTRAAAAYLAGAEALPCAWEPDEWDWAAYAADIDLCASEGITSIASLTRRIVSGEDYRILWNERCDRLYDGKPSDDTTACVLPDKRKDPVLHFLLIFCITFEFFFKDRLLILYPLHNDWDICKHYDK